MSFEAVRSTLTLRKPAAPTTPKMPPVPESAPVAALSAVPPAAPTPTPARAVPIEQFFAIWSPTELRPHYRHATLEDAQTEAARLRRIAPSKTFLIYELRLIRESEEQKADGNEAAAPAAAPTGDFR
jgi:hypothetical protein